MKQEIHFVTGKGGVGKSVIAAALALKKSQEGKKVLLVELGDQSFFKDFFGLANVGYQPVSLKPNLSLALWTGETALQEYARHLIKVDALAKLFFENSIMRAFINVAPGLPELAILGKITSGPRKHGPPLPFDCLIVDSFATGHFLALMEAPKGMAQAVQFGPMGEQSRGIDACLRNPELSKYHVVSLAEDLPMKESMELIERLEKEFSIKPNLVMNKIIDVPVSNAELTEVENENSDIGRFAKYLKIQKTHQEEVLNKIPTKLDKIQKVPLILEDQAWPLIEKIAKALS
jgi:anion-transporting  ArsA/GET3 family ATPase